MTLPFMTANGISIHYHLAGSAGPPNVVLLHEMGGTLDSWDAVVPELSKRFRTLRYDQRGAGLTEKPRQQWDNATLVDDLEAVLGELKLGPRFHIVCVAAAATQALLLMERHPSWIGRLVFCNPAPGVDASRAGALEERAGMAEREGMRASLPVTLDKSYPPELTDRATYEAYRGRYLANDPVAFGMMNRCFAHTNMMLALTKISVPTLVIAGSKDTVRLPNVTEGIARTIPGARYEVIDAGHFMPTTAPGPLLKLLCEFLA
jgi:3-oxoadipate enol-lactonase